jgi:hypothetical protein
VAGFCEHGDERSDSIRKGLFLINLVTISFSNNILHYGVSKQVFQLVIKFVLPKSIPLNLHFEKHTFSFDNFKITKCLRSECMELYLFCELCSK